MILTSHRITKKAYARSIWSGIGARDYGGRWNSKGAAVVYTAQSRSLAAIEQLVHLVSPRLLGGFVVASISFDDSRMAQVNPADLPARWSDPVPPPRLRHYGDDWVAKGNYPVLAVPSVVIPGEWNYLLNPAHPEFDGLTKSVAERFAFDRRLT